MGDLQSLGGVEGRVDRRGEGLARFFRARNAYLAVVELSFVEGSRMGSNIIVGQLSWRLHRPLSGLQVHEGGLKS